MFCILKNGAWERLHSDVQKRHRLSALTFELIGLAVLVVVSLVALFVGDGATTLTIAVGNILWRAVGIPRRTLAPAALINFSV